MSVFHEAGRRVVARTLILLLPWTALLACRREDPKPRALDLLLVRPEAGVDVLLNEPLVFHFSEELDRSSVTSDSVRIAEEHGQAARGRLEVTGSRVTFLPAPVLSPALDDGGYRPGATYTVEIAGFPRPDAMRARNGAPLRGMRRTQFRVVDVFNKSSAAVFEDSSPETAWPLELKAKRVDQIDPRGGRAFVSFVIDPLDPIVFVGGEPLDPSTVRGEDFELRWVQTDERGYPSIPIVRGDPVPLRARLSDNSEATGAELELHPMRSLSKGLYQLRVDLRELGLRDFGGNRPWIRGWDPSQIVAIRVTELGRQAPVRSFHESFFTNTMRSTAPVPHADGTAHWGSTGRVEITYPAAAGRGFDGPVVLGEREGRRDVHATSLSLPSGVACDLEGGPGLIVLRAQGRLVIDGVLRRGDQSSIGTIESRATLSGWLEKASSEAAGWTVLIAGGDLVVSGRIEVRGPLLLACGGRIRISGSVSSTQEEGVYTLGEGGGGRLIAREAPLDLDSPRENPLVEPLRFAVLSTSIPPRGGVRRWRAGARSGGYSGEGSYSVRFLSDDAALWEGSEDQLETHAVDDPAALDPSTSLILWIELTIAPGLRWDPPWVDYVEVEWDPMSDTEQL